MAKIGSAAPQRNRERAPLEEVLAQTSAGEYSTVHVPCTVPRELRWCERPRPEHVSLRLPPLAVLIALGGLEPPPARRR